MPTSGKEDVEFDLVDLERVSIGDPFKVTVNIVNKSTESRSIHAILSAESIYHNGVMANPVKSASDEFVLKPNACEFSFTESTIFFFYSLVHDEPDELCRWRPLFPYISFSISMPINILYFIDQQVRLSITADDYLDKLVESCTMKLHAIATVRETNQTWADEDDFQVLKPTIKVTVNKESFL